MLFVKMMSAEDLPDTSPHKGFQLLQIPDMQSLKFHKETIDEHSGDFNKEHPYTMTITDGESVEHFALSGNVYVMSESGKTIASYGC